MAKLRRLKDNKTESGARSEAISWNEDGTFKEVVSHKPVVGCSMLVGSITARSYSNSDYWLTTVVTEILEERQGYVKFKTMNSIYEWSE
jgi:ribosome-interacting GTPase 1